MNIEEFRDYCIAKPGVTEEMPFGPDTLVFKVGGKVFALTDINTFSSINLKCDPERAIELRDQFESIKPGYHMNKKHWNTIMLDNQISNNLLLELIDHSYNLVYSGLKKSEQYKLFTNTDDSSGTTI